MSDHDEATLSGLLRARIRDAAQQWVRLPLLAGVGDGTLDPHTFRHYLEQDYVYLRYYARIYARLAAASTSDDELEHFVALAHGVLSVELGHHRTAAAPFDCDFDEVVPSVALTRYLAFYEEHATDRAATLVAMLPCIYGYGIALPLVRDAAGDGPYRDWIDIYAGADYGALMDRHFALIDEAEISAQRAIELVDRALALETEFWNQSPNEAEAAA